MNKIQFVLLALSVAGAAVAAPKELRKPANADKLDFSLSAPNLQVLQGEDAHAYFLKLTTEQEDFSPSEKKNVEEFSLLGKELESRGYEALEKSLPDVPFAEGRRFTFFREDDQKIPAGNGEESYLVASFKIYYTQRFLRKGEKLVRNEPVPSTVLHGTLFLRCPLHTKKQCPVTGVAFHESSIKWDILPSPRGANSSAGGANNR